MKLSKWMQKAGLVTALWMAVMGSVLQGQSSTTSSLNGRVADFAGNPVTDATVRLRFEPTGTEVTASASAAGRFSFGGLRPGGPYTVTVEAFGYQPRRVTDLNLVLNQASNLDFVLAVDERTVFDLDEFTVVAGQDDLFSSMSTGARTSIDEGGIASAPTVGRSFEDLARFDPRMAVVDEAGRLQGGGANNRFNSIKIDGLSVDDPFGLSAGGQPTREGGTLIALDAIEQFTIDLTPYSVRNAGFTGAAINAITRSGTNTLSGSVYSYFRNENLVGDYIEGEKSPLASFEELTYGATLRGPILKDTLFFALSYEKVENDALAPIRRFVPDPADIARIEAVASQLGIDIGSLDAPGTSRQEDEKFTAKLDWVINPNHRVSFLYNDVVSVFPNFRSLSSSSATSYTSYWDVETFENTRYSIQSNNRWSDSFSTEAIYAYSKFFKFFDLGSEMPEVQIAGVRSATGSGTGTLYFGTEVFRHGNVLEVETDTFDLYGELNLGKQDIIFGMQYETADIYNLFHPYSRGQYRYSNIDQFETAAVGGAGRDYEFRYAMPGRNPAAEFTQRNLAFFIEDRLTLSDRLTLTAGLRIDTPIVPEAPLSNPLVEETFGIRNDATIDGNRVIQPRVSFNLAVDPERKTQLRGGLGLFYGKQPQVWLSNSYSNNGLSIASLRLTGSNVPPFSVEQEVPTDGTLPRFVINMTDPDFELPSNWKANFAVDHQLPWYGMTVTAEAIWSWVNNGIHYTHLNLNEAGRLPDGRILYTGSSAWSREAGFNEVIYLTNTDQGHADNYTLSIDRPMSEDGWAFTAAYNYQNAEDVQPGTSSQAISSWRARGVINPNEEVAARSDYEIKHRFIASVSKEFRWSERLQTIVNVVYEGRSGRPFSYVFANDINADRVNSGGRQNDLLYVPAGTSDPLYGGMADPSTEAAFFRYIDAHLGGYKGQIAPRNIGTESFIHQWDLNITQRIGMIRDNQLELIFSIKNFGNLLNKDWGQVSQLGTFPRTVRVASGSVVDGKYVYNFNEAAVKNEFRETNRISRWQALLGVRYLF